MPQRAIPAEPTARKSPRGERGSLIVYLALALVAFGLLAMAGVTRFGASLTSVLSPNCATAARYMAEAGLRYATARLRICTTVSQLNTTVSALNSGTFTVDQAKGLGFSLVVSYDSNYTATITATGRGCAILAPATATAAASTVNLPVVAAFASTPIDFSNLADDFMRTSSLGATNPITVDSSTNTISFGTVTGTHNAAAIWYAGNATQGCVNGNCTMDNGLRAYFDVQWDPASVADGMVFGVMSAVTNALTAVGGDSNMGELMGWAGPGTSGQGIQPPKIGIEFDTWYNSCSTTPFVAGSRCDPSNYTYGQPDHMAYVFWGSNTAPSPYNGRSGNTYDDNQHGAGNGGPTEPISSNDPDGMGSGLYGMYYAAQSNWLRSGTKYYVRYELTRLTTPSSASTATYCYVLKTWVISSTPSTAYKTVTADYDSTTYPPTIQQVIFLNSTYHVDLNKVFFGWTEATGDFAQNIKVADFVLAFKKAQPNYGTAPTGYTAYWPMFDNIGSTVTNPVSSSLNGTIYGTARWVPGIVNNNGAALYFNGGTYMSVPDNSALDLQAVGGVSLWFKMYGSNTGAWILHKGTTSSSNEAYGLGVNWNGTLRFRLRYGTNSSNYVEVTSTTVPVQGKWYHVVASWQNPGTPLTLYVNGTPEGTATVQTAQNSNGAFFLGSGSTSTSTAFTGIIDEVYLYKQVLTQANVTALATGAP
ncbi:MAG: LamG domain-containing protein [Humidesulfovibrio sp.]|nr:LamG domain-containing protein [Humidesulfovibrio sp.]